MPMGTQSRKESPSHPSEIRRKSPYQRLSLIHIYFVFYGAMVSEGIIALVWAAAGCALYEVTGGRIGGSVHADGELGVWASRCCRMVTAET